MKIIHVILGKANPNRMNGVNKVVNSLAENQYSAGLDVEVWGITHSLEHDYPTRSYPTRLFKKQSLLSGLDKDLIQAIASVDSTCVFHLHGGFIIENYYVSKLLQKQQIPYLFMPHGAYNTIALNKNKWIKKIYFQLFEKEVLIGARYIHLIGKSESDGINHPRFNTKIRLIPYGYSIAEINARPSSKPNNEFVITYCGRLDIHNKGLKELVAGFDLFYQDSKNAQLHIIGDSDERNQLEQFAHATQAHAAIHFHGAKFAEDKIALLTQSHVFALTSLNEGLPASVLEAASLGIPSLLTKACNLTHEITTYNAGYIIDKTDAKEIYNGLKHLYTKLIDQHLFIEMGHNAIRMVENEFSWDKTIRELNKLYLHARA